MIRHGLFLTAVGILALGGCGTPTTPTAPVRGTVTLDTKPLDEGKIVFSTPGRAPEALPIKDGKFEGTVEVGERKVEIMAYKDAPPFPMEGVTAEPSKINYLPARYNTESQLKASVKADGSNDLKFDLKSSR